MVTTLSSTSAGIHLGYTAPSNEQIDILPLPNPFYEDSTGSTYVSSGTYLKPKRNVRKIIGEHSFKLFTTLQARHSVRKAYLMGKKGGYHGTV